MRIQQLFLLPIFVLLTGVMVSVPATAQEKKAGRDMPESQVMRDGIRLAPADKRQKLEKLSNAGTYLQTMSAEDGSPISFVIHVSKKISEEGKVPLIVALHYGAASYSQFSGGNFLTRMVKPAAKGTGAIIIAPDIINRSWANETCEDRILQLVNQVLETYPIDGEKTLVVGISIGGKGAWHYAARHPNIFKGMICVSGAPPESLDTKDWKVPAIAIHSSDDEVFPIAPVREAIDSIDKASGNAALKELEGYSHYESGAYIEPLTEAFGQFREKWGITAATEEPSDESEDNSVAETPTPITEAAFDEQLAEFEDAELDTLQETAAAGNAPAQFALADRLLKNGVEEDALEWFEKAAQRFLKADNGLTELNRCIKKIFDLSNDSMASWWETARDLNARENCTATERLKAILILSALSPEDKPRLAKAHVWRANQYLRLNNRRFSESHKRRYAAAQLQLALQAEPENVDAQVVLAEKVYIPEQNFRGALDIYTGLFDNYVGYYVKIAELYVAMGEGGKANIYIEEAVTRYDKLLEYTPNDVTYLRRRANAHAMLNDHETAATQLLAALQKTQSNSDKATLQRALSKIYLARASRIADQMTAQANDKNSRQEFLKYLSKAYELDPENDLIRIAITRFASQGYEETAQATAVYDVRQNPDEAPSDALQVAGTWEILNGNRELGIRLLGIAIQNNPRNHEALNNLAYSLLDSDTDRALALAERAVQLQPTTWNYRDTRGTAYVRKKEYRKAIADLEAVLQAVPDKESVIEQLVVCYEEIGMSNQAQRLQKRLKKDD